MELIPYGQKLLVLEQVSSSEYLGYSVSYNASNDVVNKLHKVSLMCGTIRRTLKSASKGTRLKFYKVMVLPSLLFGIENWTLTKGQTSRIQAAEMRFLRHVAGYSLHDHRRNTYIRQELNIMSILDRIS